MQRGTAQGYSAGNQGNSVASAGQGCRPTALSHVCVTVPVALHCEWSQIAGSSQTLCPFKEVRALRKISPV